MDSPRLSRRDELHWQVRENHAFDNLQLREQIADQQRSISMLMEINVNLVEANETIIRQRDQARRALSQLTESLGFHAEECANERDRSLSRNWIVSLSNT